MDNVQNYDSYINILQDEPDSIRQFLIINNQSIQQHNKRYFPIFPCVVGLIGY
jgi:hypothetical protein